MNKKDKSRNYISTKKKKLVLLFLINLKDASVSPLFRLKNKYNILLHNTPQIWSVNYCESDKYVRIKYPIAQIV